MLVLVEATGANAMVSAPEKVSWQLALRPGVTRVRGAPTPACSRPAYSGGEAARFEQS